MRVSSLKVYLNNNLHSFSIKFAVSFSSLLVVVASSTHPCWPTTQQRTHKCRRLFVGRPVAAFVA